MTAGMQSCVSLCVRVCISVCLYRAVFCPVFCIWQSLKHIKEIPVQTEESGFVMELIDDSVGAGRFYAEHRKPAVDLCANLFVCFLFCLLQPWRFIVLQSPSRRNRRAQALTPASPVATNRASATPVESSAFMPGTSTFWKLSFSYLFFAFQALQQTADLSRL